MNINKFNKPVLKALMGAFVLVCAPALASYPDRPITMIVPAGPGGAADTLSRMAADRLGKELGEPVVVMNRPGAAATIGMTELAQAKNDGYNIGMVFAGAMAVNPSIYKTLRYDPQADYDPISLVALSPLVIAVNSGLGIDTIQDLVAYAKKNPGKLTFGSSGTGSTQHLCMEYLKSFADVDMMHVPYKGSAASANDLLGGVISLLCENSISISPQFEGGKIKPLAVTTGERLASLPKVPTVAESGYPGFQANGWYGLVAPAGTPPAIVDRMSAIINEMIQSDAVQADLLKRGMVPFSNTPAEFKEYIREETKKWSEVAKQAGIEPQ